MFEWASNICGVSEELFKSAFIYCPLMLLLFLNLKKLFTSTYYRWIAGISVGLTVFIVWVLTIWTVAVLN